MPIAQIFVAPSVAQSIAKQEEALTRAVTAALLEGLSPKPETIQVMLVPALAPSQGCDVLCVVQHRASDSRTAEIRQKAANHLHDVLAKMTGHSVRVRLIALASDTIAAKDTDRSK